jgi:hypothetical protein
MTRFAVLGAVAAGVVALLAPPAVAPVSGRRAAPIYAFDHAYNTVATPTSLPDRGPTDTIYVFPECTACASVRGRTQHASYNGGRWKVVAAYGI